MNHSSQSLFIKKIDLVQPNKQKTTILPPPAARGGQTKYKSIGQQERKDVRCYHRDRLIEPVLLPHKKATALEEVLRQATLKRFESRDRRLKEFQSKKRIVHERLKMENERRRQQFLENRERVKREEAERLMERDRKRREDRLFYKAQGNRQRVFGRNLNYDGGSSKKPDHMRFQKNQRKGSLDFSESTISLYGVEKNKPCKPNIDQVSQKLRIHLPQNKMHLSPKPKNQPYYAGKRPGEQINPCDRNIRPCGPSKLVATAIHEQTSSNFAKYSYIGSTAYSRMKKAEEKARSHNEKKGISYKLSHSKVYAPSRWPVRHKKSSSGGNRIASSRLNLANPLCRKEDLCNQDHRFVRVYTNKCANSQKEAEDLESVRTHPQNSSQANEDQSQKACKSDLHDDVDCRSPLSTSIVCLNASKSSIKSASCSRKTSSEEDPPPVTSQTGTPVHTVSITSKSIQSNPIDRTSKSVQCPNTCRSEEDRQGADDYYSETFMCEETSLTRLMSTTSDVDDVQLKVTESAATDTIDSKKDIKDSQNTTITVSVAEKEEEVEEIARSDHRINQPIQDYQDVVYMPYYYDHSVYNCLAGHNLVQSQGHPFYNYPFNSQDQYIVIDPTVQNQTETMHAFQGFDQSSNMQAGMPMNPAEMQYVIINNNPTETSNFQCNKQLPVFGYQPYLSPETKILVGTESCDEIIVVCDPVGYSMETQPIGVAGNQFMELDPPWQIEFNPQCKDQIKNGNGQHHEPNATVEYKISKDAQSCSTNDQINISGPCLHICQVDCNFKDQVTIPLKVDGLILNKTDLATDNQTGSLKQQSTEQNDDQHEQHLKENNQSKLNRWHVNKEESLRPQKDTSVGFPGSESCKSIDIVITAYLMNNESTSSAKEITNGTGLETTVDNFLIEYYSPKANRRTGSKDPDSQRDNKDVILIAEDQQVPPIQLSLDEAELKSEPSGYRSDEGSDRVQKHSNNQHVNFSLPLGKSGSKRIQADICCTYCSSAENDSPKPPNLFDNNQIVSVFDDSIHGNDGNPEKDQISKSTKYTPNLSKCTENDPEAHSRRTRLQTFRKIYKTEFKTSSRMAFRPKSRLDQVPEEYYVLNDKNYEDSYYSHRYRSSVNESGSVFHQVPTLSPIQCNNGGQKGVPKRNHAGRDRTPHRKPKKTKPSKKAGLRNSGRRNTKKESSTVLGLYEQNQFSIVSLYRKSSQLKAKWRSKLSEIKKKYSHILTSTSSSELHKHSLDILLPDSASLVQINANIENPRNNRNCSTITCFGSTKSMLNSFDFISRSDHEKDQNDYLFHHKTEDSSGKADMDNEEELFAKACWLVVPVSFRKVLEKVYYEIRKDLFHRNSATTDGYTSHKYRQESRLRGGMDHVPIYHDVQVQILIRSLAVLRHFERAVGVVHNQIQSNDEFDSLIKHYLTCEISKKINAILEDSIDRLYNKIDHFEKNAQGFKRLKSENQFMKDVIHSLQRLKIQILYNNFKKTGIDLPEEMHSVPDKLLENLETFVLHKLDELCQDVNLLSCQEVSVIHQIPMWLQEALHYLCSVDNQNSYRIIDECPKDIVILSSNLAKNMMYEFFT